MSIVLENEGIRVSIRPELGGKITSFYEKEHHFELAAQKSERIRDKGTGKTSDFGQYAYGMDDAFPNINREIYQWDGSELSYPDHGEIWSKELKVEGQTESLVSLLGRGTAFSYEYRKEIRLTDSGLVISYRIVNTGAGLFPCIWTWHGLIRYEEDAVLQLPQGTKAFRNVLQSDRLGEPDSVYVAEEPPDTDYDFQRLPARASLSCEKYYIEGKVTEGKCGMLYPSQGMKMTLQYDERKLPYLGFWVTAGGLEGDYNCALEPSNGFYDGINTAAKNGSLVVLKSGERLEFDLSITLTGVR